MSRLVPMHLVILARRGWTQSEVARAYGVSRQAVSDFARRHDIEWPGLTARQQDRPTNDARQPLGLACSVCAGPLVWPWQGDTDAARCEACGITHPLTDAAERSQ